MWKKENRHNENKVDNQYVHPDHSYNLFEIQESFQVYTDSSER
jgi:hypothetical protein